MFFKPETAKRVQDRTGGLEEGYKGKSSNNSNFSNRAAQNRLTISIKLRFFNRKKEEDDLEQSFSFFYDYPGSAQLVGSQKTTAHEEIFERITQDIFNATLAKW